MPLTIEDAIGFGLIVFVSFGLFYIFLDRKSRNDPKYLLDKAEREYRKKKRYEVRLERKEKAYRVLKRIPFLDRYITRLRYEYLCICPYDERTLSSHIIGTLFTSLFISLVVVGCIFGINLFAFGTPLGFYFILSSIFGVYVTFDTIRSKRLSDVREKVDVELGRLLEGVSHRYLATKEVIASIEEVSEDLSFEMKLVSNEIRGLLSGAAKYDNVRAFVSDRDKNKTLRLFVAQCFEACENGDVECEGESTFVKNINILQNDIRVKSRETRKHDFELRGVLLAIIIGVVPMGLSRYLGLRFEDTMISFYNRADVIMQIACVASGVLVYSILSRTLNIGHESFGLQRNKLYDRLCELRSVKYLADKLKKRFFKTTKKIELTAINLSVGSFYSKVILYSVVGMVVVFGALVVSHGANRENCLTMISGLDGEFSFDEEHTKKLEKEMLMVVNEYKDDDVAYITNGEIISNISLDRLRNEKQRERVALLIKEQIRKYQNETYKWYDFALSLFGLFAGCIPVLELNYLYKLSQDAKTDEVRDFYLIILLQRNFKKTTVVSLLTELESHSFVYSLKLRTAVNICSKSQTEALEYLRHDDYLPFRNLIDCFLSVERVGINAAFSEIDMKLKADDADNRLEAEQRFENTKFKLEILSFVPMTISFMFYTVLPLLVIAWNNTQQELSSLSQ